MPSHKIHLKIAQVINQNLHLDTDAIMLGSVLPDLTIEKNHALSHYQVKGSYEDTLANPDKFIHEYKKQLQNPIMLGYLIHLLTDRYYNNYFMKQHCLMNESGKPYCVKRKNGTIKKTINIYKKSDFVKYDKWLLKHHLVGKFHDIKCVDAVTNLRVGKFDKDYLKQYILQANREVDVPKLYPIKTFLFYKVLYKKELDDLMDNCCQYIFNYIKDNLEEGNIL